MPIFNPSTHDDLIDITITLSQPLGGIASLTTILILQDDVTPGGGLFAEYTSPTEVAADVALTNLDATSQKIADIMFGQSNPPERLVAVPRVRPPAASCRGAVPDRASRTGRLRRSCHRRDGSR